jgi:hypothetical protein
MNEDRMEWTAGGNHRAATMDVYLEWICLAWESLSKEMIAKSFKGYFTYFFIALFLF